MSEHNTDIVPAERVRTILARAAEIDAKGIAGINIAELQKIAAEAGISSAAFAQAMREEVAPVYAAQPAASGAEETPASKPKLWDRIRASTPYLFVGLVFGGWAVSLRDDEIAVMSVGAILLIALYRVFAHRKERDTTAFQFEVLTMFAGLYAAWGAGGALGNPEIATGIPVIAVVSALIGTAVITVAGKHIELTDRTSDRQNAVAS